MADRLYDSVEGFKRGLDHELELAFMDASQLIRKWLMEGYATIQRITPRDTVRAANGWMLTSGQPSDYVPPEGEYPEPPPPDDPGHAENWTWYLTNNVEYISVLEDGYSDQAPEGMVAITLNDLTKTMEKYAQQSEYFE